MVTIFFSLTAAVTRAHWNKRAARPNGQVWPYSFSRFQLEVVAYFTEARIGLELWLANAADRSKISNEAEAIPAAQESLYY